VIDYSLEATRQRKKGIETKREAPVQEGTVAVTAIKRGSKQKRSKSSIKVRRFDKEHHLARENYQNGGNFEGVEN